MNVFNPVASQNQLERQTKRSIDRIKARYELKEILLKAANGRPGMELLWRYHEIQGLYLVQLPVRKQVIQVAEEGKEQMRGIEEVFA